MMSTHESMQGTGQAAARISLSKQRSHVLFVLSNARAGQDAAFLEWYRGSYSRAALDDPVVLKGAHYEQHDVDITRGRYPGFPFRYLALYELSLDGAERARGFIERVTALHAAQAAAQDPATWLYYAACEKVGRAPTMNPSMLTIAYANGIPGQEADFREWYATRHIRHAMQIPALVSGQCFERTLFQLPGTQAPPFATIAIYEQEGTPEDILASFATLPEGALYFPMLDRTRFAECTYRPV
jgi:hypothetical protein